MDQPRRPQTYPGQTFPGQAYPGPSYGGQPQPGPVSAYSGPGSYPVQAYHAGRVGFTGQVSAPAPMQSGPLLAGRPSPPPRPRIGQPFPGQAPPPVPPARPRRKRRLALKLLLLAVVGLVAAVVLTSPRQPEPVRAPDTGTVAQPGTLSVFDLRPGDCYSTKEAPPAPGRSQPISYVEAVACTSPHTNQVVAIASYSPVDSRADVLAGRADSDCNAQFQAKLDPGVAGDPTLKPGRIAPADDATWARKPLVSCVVYSDGPISRSLVR